MRLTCCLLCVALLLGCVGCSRNVNAPPYDGIVLIDPGHGGFDGGAVASLVLWAGLLQGAVVAVNWLVKHFRKGDSQ